MEIKDKVIMFAMLLVIIALLAVLIMKRKSLFASVDHFTEEEEDFVDDEPVDEAPAKEKTPAKPAKKVVSIPAKSDDKTGDTEEFEEPTTVHAKKAVDTLQTALATLTQKLEGSMITPEDKTKLLKELFTEGNLSTMLNSGAVSLPSTINKVVTNMVNSVKLPKAETYADAPETKINLDAVKRHIKAAMDEIDALEKKPMIGETSSTKKTTEGFSIEGFENAPRYAMY